MSLRINSGSAWWGDRISPAALNAEQGDLDCLCFETIAESTISAAQVRQRRGGSGPCSMSTMPPTGGWQRSPAT